MSEELGIVKAKKNVSFKLFLIFLILAILISLVYLFIEYKQTEFEIYLNGEKVEFMNYYVSQEVSKDTYLEYVDKIYVSQLNSSWLLDNCEVWKICDSENLDDCLTRGNTPENKKYKVVEYECNLVENYSVRVR